MFSGMTGPSGPSAPSGFQRVAQPRQAEHLGLVEILDRIEAAVHVAIERRVADRHFRLVAGRHHHQAELVGDRHQDRAAGARLQILFGDVARHAGEDAGCSVASKPCTALFDRHHVVVHAERLARSPRRRRAIPARCSGNGSITQRTRSAPSASTAIAAHSAESMPPERPSTTPGKPFLST